MITITKDKYIYRMDKLNKPVMESEPGSIICFVTNDCFQGQLKTNADLVADIDFGQINLATGPVYIKGAEPGDTLQVEILSIDVAETAVTVAVPNLGLLGAEVKSSQTEVITIKNGLAYYREQVYPIEPMIGVIGTAPLQEAVPCGTPGSHGGNMDCKDIKAGSTLYLPVNVDGGLLAIGDVHALQGDGEICGTGFECAAEVLVRVSLVKNQQYNMPFLTNKDEIMAIGYGETLRTACERAAAGLLNWLLSQKTYSFNQAYMLLSAKMDLRICQLVNPQMTVRAVLSKKDIY